MKIRAFIAAIAFIGISAAVAQAPSLLQQFPPGFALQDGSQLNKIVSAINSGMNCATFRTAATPVATDVAFFVSTRAQMLVSASEVHAVAAGGASVLQLTKDTGTAAAGTGTDLLTTGFDLNGTAETVQVGAITATAATKTFAAGDRLSVDFAQAIQSSSGIVLTACFAPVQ